jgi:transposase
VTTLYFEAESEDEPRKVGYSKERRVDPQIVVGLLVDRTGFPLEIGCFEGNTAETTTLVPIITSFAARHDLGDTPMVVAADAACFRHRTSRISMRPGWGSSWARAR